MKRHISIFMFLLSAFAVVGQARANVKVACLEEVTLTFGKSSKQLSLHPAAGSEGYYNDFLGDMSLTAPANPPSDSSGKYRAEWFTLPADDAAGTASKISDCTDSIAKGNTITVAQMGKAKKSGWAYYCDPDDPGPLIALKYIKQCTISTSVSPDGAGTVSGGATVDAGESVTLTATPNTGWEFSKWSDDITDNPRTISNIKADATYTAEFKRPSFDLTLGVKEGVARIGYKTGSGSSFTYVTKDTVIKADYGSSYDLIAEAAGGWSFSGSSTTSETFSNITSAKTFAPVSERATYTVTVDANGGSGGSCPSYTVSASQQTKSITLPTRTGYSIASSWDVSGASGGTPTVAGNTLTIPAGTYGNLTLTPTWTANTYSLTVNPNGGSYEGLVIEQKLQALRYDAKNLNAISVATRENYTLSGYYTSSSGGTKVYDGNGRNVECDYWTAAYPDGTFKGTSELRVYAIWTPNASTVTLDKQGGTGGASSVSVKYDTTVPAIASLPTRTGYAFEGYYTGKNGGGRKYYNANGEGLEKWISTGTTTLYANWTPNGYKVQYDLGGGSTGADAPSSAKVGTAFRVSTPMRVGYTFTGWNVTGAAADYTTAKWGVASDAASTAIPNASAVCFNEQLSCVYFLNLTMAQDATVTLKANWTANSYEVAVSPNGGSGGSCPPYTVSTSQQTKTITLPTRGGYSISKWTVSGASGGTPTVSGTTLTIPAGTYGKLTLTPTWTANSYDVAIDANGGSGGSCESYTVSTSQQTKMITLPKRDGYSISKWTVSGASGGTPTVSGTTLTIPAGTYGKLTLTPTWTAVSYTITYSGLKAGSTHNNPSSYTIASPAIVFSAASDVSDYKFLSWSPASIPSGSTGNKTVTANYLTKIQKPSVTSQLTYSGSSQSCTSSSLNNMQVSGNAATIPGSYTATFTPNSGYCWSDGSTAAYSVDWEIVNAEISDVSVSQSGSLTYIGEAQAPAVDARATTRGSQTAVWKYSKTAGGYAAQVPTFTDAGTYTVYYEVSARYHNPKTGSFSVTIGPSKTASLTLSKTQFGYTGKEQGPTVTCVNCAEVSGSEKTGTEVGTYNVKAKPSKNYAWSDGSTESKSFAWQIVEGSFTVTIAPGEGGEGGSTVSYQTSQNAQTKQISLPKRKGYEIESWTASGYTGTAPTISSTTLTIPAHTAGNFTMTPTWKAKKYNLTIDPNKGLFNRSTDPTTFEGVLTFDATNMNVIAVSVKEDGTPFLGYYTTGGVPVYNDAGKCVLGETYWDGDWPDGKYVNDGNLTVVARWSEASRYDIVVEADPAKGTATGGGTFEAGTPVTLTATQNTGYLFCCWSNATDVVSTDNPYEFTMSSAAAGTYIAVFTGKVYKVTCLAIFGSPSSQEAFTQMGMPWDLPTATREGYDFAGWRTEQMDGGEKIIEGSPVTAEPPKYLYDSWTEKKPTIIYADPSYKNIWITNSVDKSHEITDAEARAATKGWEATRDHKYWIKGWEPTLTPPLKVETNVTITAIWESFADVLDWHCPDLPEQEFRVDGNWKVYTQDHYPNVGESCLRLENVSEGDNVSTTVTGPGTLAFHWRSQAGAILRVKRDGVEEGGVFTATSDEWTENSVEIGEGETTVIFTCIPQESPDVFRELDFIVWTPKASVETYDVVYQKGTYGAGVGRTDTKTNGVDLVLAGALFTRDNYTQDSWSKNKDGSTSDYALGETYDENAAIILYPHWLEKGKYTVSYSAGTGATGSAASQTAHEGETVTLHGDGHFSRTGYSQDGWATADLGGKAFEFGEVYGENVSTNLYPCWTNNRYKVTFNPNGGSVTPEPQVVTYDEAYGEPPKLDDRGDYKFAGWTLASGDAVTATTIVKTAEDHELIAKWTKDLGPYSKALDCEKLKFELVTDGWFVCNETPHKGDSCLRSATSGAELTATITESGTLTFWWRGEAGDDMIQLEVTGNVKETLKIYAEDPKEEWEPKSIDITASAEAPVTFKFTCGSRFDGTCDIDDVTWTPEGGGKPTPGDSVEVTEAGVADGVFKMTIWAENETDYGVWTNADLTVDSWGLMGEPQPGKGKPLEFKWTILPGFSQLFFRAHEVKYK